MVKSLRANEPSRLVRAALAVVACAGAIMATTGVTGAAHAGPAFTQTVVNYETVASSETLTLVVPSSGKGPFPVVALVHGGGFAMGDSSMESQYAADLANEGIASASVNYRLAGQAKYPAGVQDAKAAIRWLRANSSKYKLNPKAIGIWGQSAGGFLANIVGATGDQKTIFDDASLGNGSVSSAVQTVVSWYGPTDFGTMDSQLACGSNSQTHGDAASFESQWLGSAVKTSSLTPSTNVSTYVKKAKVLPVWFLTHGDKDCNVPGGQSAELAATLKSLHANFQYVILHGAGHMDPMFDTKELAPTLAFLKKQLSAK